MPSGTIPTGSAPVQICRPKFRTKIELCGPTALRRPADVTAGPSVANDDDGVSLDLQSLAHALNGEVISARRGREVRAPGPGHSAKGQEHVCPPRCRGAGGVFDHSFAGGVLSCVAIMSVSARVYRRSSGTPRATTKYQIRRSRTLSGKSCRAKRAAK
jgi:hypothetical protein